MEINWKFRNLKLKREREIEENEEGIAAVEKCFLIS